MGILFPELLGRSPTAVGGYPSETSSVTRHSIFKRKKRLLKGF